MKSSLVTGAKGFVGSKLIESLVNLGQKPLSLDEEYFFENNWHENLISKLNEFNPNAIFHVGACSDTLEKNVQFMMERNYESTKILMNWATDHEIPFIYSSSAANYGINGLYPSNLYGWSKYVAEDFVRLSGGIGLRYFNVYGPGEERKGKMASFLFQAYIKSNSKEEIKIFPGIPRRDFIYVDDVVSANLHAYHNYPKLRGKIYEVSTGVASSFEEVLEIANIEFMYHDSEAIPEGYQFYTKGNSAKWMEGWRPEFSLEKGIQSYIKILNSSSQ